MNTKRLINVFLLVASLQTASVAQDVSLHFDGSNDYVQTTFSAPTGTAARTVEAWIKTTANSVPGVGGQRVIVDWGTFVTGGRFTFNALWNNAIRIEVGGNGLSGTIAINDGLWHHVAVVYDPSLTTNYYLYVDGVLDTSGNLTVPTNTGSLNQLQIGQRIDGVNEFEGSIDEVRIFNSARTLPQIISDMNGEFCSIPANLVAYYSINDGIANGSNNSNTTIEDLAGSNDGTLLNFSLSGTTSNWVSGSGISPAGVQTTLTIDTCNVFTSPSGSYIWDIPGTYYDTLVNPLGCDTTLTVNLTFNSAIPLITNVNACGSYTTPSGQNTWTQSGIFYETEVNTNGCDTLKTFNVTIENDVDAYISISECHNYTLPDGNSVTQSGIYYSHTIPGTIGCDTAVYVDLDITGPTFGSYIDSVCGMFITPSGNQIASSGIYLDTISNSIGCDSVITLNIILSNGFETNLTLNGNTLTALSNTSIDSYQWVNCVDDFAPIPGETNSYFTPTTNGYYAIISSSGNCIDTTDCIAITGIGIQELVESISIFPNPIQDKLQLNLGKIYEKMTIKIFDVFGRLVLEDQITKIESWSTAFPYPFGLYTIQISTPEHQFNKKIIKQ